LPSSRLSGLLVGASLALAPAGRALPAESGPVVLRVDGALPKTGGLTRAELESLGSSTATWTAHGEKRTVTGVPLDRVLERFGWTAGPMGKEVPKAEKRAGYRKVVVATARDGFQAVFSCAEIAEGMGATRALVAWAIDGKPLPPDMGPLRLVVLTDGEPARSIYQLESLKVLEVAAGAPAGR